MERQLRLKLEMCSVQVQHHTTHDQNTCRVHFQSSIFSQKPAMLRSWITQELNITEIYIFRYHIMFLESANIKHNTITIICLGKWNSIVSNKLGWSQIKHICRDLNSKAAGQVRSAKLTDWLCWPHKDWGNLNIHHCSVKIVVFSFCQSAASV